MSNAQIQRSNGTALPSLDRCKAILDQTKSADEVKKIRILAQAVASSERGKEIALDAGEIVLFADARIGELTKEMAKAPPDKRGQGNTNQARTVGLIVKAEALAESGLTTQQASRCERVASLKESGALDKLVTAERAAGRVPSVRAAIELARLPQAQQTEVLARLPQKQDVKAAIGEVKLDAKRAKAEEIRANPVVTPDGRYQVIVSDPPWKYDARAEDTTHRGKNLYPEMTVPEICALPVGKLAQPDCILWLWTTNAFMRGAYECLDAWGFQEKTILTWDKELLGLGDWLRNVTEHCILAVRGKPIVSLTNQTTMIREKRREHSRKPEAFYAMVEALCPGSKLEMFSRTPRAGWAAWGAETGKFDAA